MEDRRSIAKKAAIGVALVIAAAGAVLFYKNNIAMNPGDTLLKYMSYAEDGKYEKMYDLLNEESQKSISKEEFIKRNKNIYKGIGVQCNFKEEINNRDISRKNADKCWNYYL